MAEAFIQSAENGRKTYLVNGLSMRRCIIFDANENLIGGQAWLEDIKSTGKAEELVVLRNPPVDAYRKDATEEWGNSSFPQ